MGQSQVMRLVYTAIREARRQDTVPIPVRLIRHTRSASLPFSLRLLRPDKIQNLSMEMAQDGFRLHEPLLVTDTLTSLLKKKYYPSICIAGNARLAAARQVDFVFIPSHVIREKSVVEMVAEMETEDLLFQISSSIEQRLERVIALLIVGAQHKEPYPESMSPLQQVALLRTYKCNDLYGAKSDENTSKTYGKASELRERIFGPNYVLYAKNAPHFLKKKWDDRNLNKVVRGAMLLIEAELNDECASSKELEDQRTPQSDVESDSPRKISVLDLLLRWESEDLMPPFLETHILNVSNMSITEICEVVNGSRKALADGEGRPLVRAVMEDSVLKSMRNKGPATSAVMVMILNLRRTLRLDSGMREERGVRRQRLREKRQKSKS